MMGVQGRGGTREADRIQGNVVQGVVQRECDVKYKDEVAVVQERGGGGGGNGWGGRESKK